MERSRVVVTKAGVSSSGSIFDQKRCAIFLGGDRSNACFSATTYLRSPPHHQQINGQQQDHHDLGGGGSTFVNGRSSTEISIFDAHKYFNEICITNDAQKDVVVCGDHDQCDDVSTVVPSRSSWASSSVVDHDSNYSSIGRNVYRARSFHGAAAVTPTASSEASWNSQTGLLSNPPGTIAVSLRSPTLKIRGQQTTPPSTSTPRWFRFPRRCPCSGKKSVQVEGQKSSQPNSTTPPPPLPARRETHDNVEMNKKETSSSSSLSLVSLPPPRDHDHQYNVWGQERPRRNWEPQVTINTIAPAVAAVKEPSKPPMGVPFNKDQGHTTSTGFSFPILKLNGGTMTSSSTMNSLHDRVVNVGKICPPDLKHQIISSPRDSLEVFGGSGQPLVKSSSNEQSSTILRIQKPNSTDHHHHHLSSAGFTFPASPKSRRVIPNNNSNNIEDDVDAASDTSSDLFEIESLSTSTTGTAQITQSMLYQYWRRSRNNSLDDENMRRLGANVGSMYSRQATEYYCYEPSEASVDWSVTTAEGFTNAASESAAEHAHDDQLEKMSSTRRNSCSGNNYGLLSCRWEKAVSTVGPNPVKLIMPAAEGQDAVGPPPPHHRPPSSQSSKYSATTKHVESRPPLPKNNKLPRLR